MEKSTVPCVGAGCSPIVYRRMFHYGCPDALLETAVSSALASEIGACSAVISRRGNAFPSTSQCTRDSDAFLPTLAITANINAPTNSRGANDSGPSYYRFTADTRTIRL